MRAGAILRVTISTRFFLTTFFPKESGQRIIPFHSFIPRSGHSYESQRINTCQRRTADKETAEETLSARGDLRLR